jgi:hypothetical protein
MERRILVGVVHQNQEHGQATNGIQLGDFLHTGDSWSVGRIRGLTGRQQQFEQKLLVIPYGCLVTMTLAREGEALIIWICPLGPTLIILCLECLPRVGTVIVADPVNSECAGG